MSDAFGIEPLQSQVTAGEDSPEARVEVDVSNGLDRHVQAGVEVRAEEPTEAAWVTVEPESFALDANESRRLGVQVAPPPGTPAGQYRFSLRVYDVDRPSEAFATGPQITVEVQRAPEPGGGTPGWLLPVLGAVLLLVIGGIVWRLVAGGDPVVVDPPPVDDGDNGGNGENGGGNGGSVSDIVTAVATGSVDAGTAAGTRVLCPSGTVALGGGVDPANVLTLDMSSSAPVFGGGDGERTVAVGDGQHAGPTGWFAAIRNPTSERRDFRVSALCAPAGAVSAVTVVSSGRASAGGFDATRVHCPSGTVALGGGLDTTNILGVNVSSTAPVFGSGSGDRLVSVGDGRHPAPIGWQASIRNPSSAAHDYRVAVVCAPASEVEAAAVADSGSAPAGSFGTVRVHCPSGMVAAGGGADLSNVLRFGMSASAPAFGRENADRLIFRDEGQHPAPVAWQVAVPNPSVEGGSFSAAVLCVPA